MTRTGKIEEATNAATILRFKLVSPTIFCNRINETTSKFFSTSTISTVNLFYEMYKGDISKKGGIF